LDKSSRLTGEVGGNEWLATVTSCTGWNRIRYREESEFREDGYEKAKV